MKPTINQIWKEKCPNCGEGEVFAVKGSLFKLKMPEMNHQCPNCNHSFEKEPGYFFGAMYVAYGLGVAEMMAVFVACWFSGISFTNILYVILAAMLLLATFNYRKSRVIWLSFI